LERNFVAVITATIFKNIYLLGNFATVLNCRYVSLFAFCGLLVVSITTIILIQNYDDSSFLVSRIFVDLNRKPLF
jgi:hypothetical protein